MSVREIFEWAAEWGIRAREQAEAELEADATAKLSMERPRR